MSPTIENMPITCDICKKNCIENYTISEKCVFCDNCKKSGKKYLIHYLNWHSGYDEWVGEERLDNERKTCEWGGYRYPIEIIKVRNIRNEYCNDCGNLMESKICLECSEMELEYFVEYILDGVQEWVTIDRLLIETRIQCDWRGRFYEVKILKTREKIKDLIKF